MLPRIRDHREISEVLPFVAIFRIRRSDHGTEGILCFGAFSCYTLELTWRNNWRNISCIPPGIYDVQIRVSPRYGRIYWVMNVAGRKYILVHPGNWAGDVKKGLKTHTNGCILTGKYRGWLQGQRAVLASRITLKKFMSLLGGSSFKLNIIEAF